jgi:hypothetical protein
MAPRLTQAKLTRWNKKIEAAQHALAGVLDEVNSQTANAKGKHYQDLCDLRVDLRRTTERAELCATGASRIRP